MIGGSHAGKDDAEGLVMTALAYVATAVDSKVCVDEHVQDQLIIFMALAVCTVLYLLLSLVLLLLLFY